MKPPELKSVWFVTSGRITVAHAIWETHGDESKLRHADGLVRSGDNVYDVTLDAETGNACTCTYGTTHAFLPKDSHSHDTALRVEVERQHRGQNG